MTGLDLEAIRTRAQRVRDERQTTSGVPLPVRLSWDVDALLDAVETLTRERDEARAEADTLAARHADAVSALVYIERRYGRLDGIGWDRVLP